MQKLVLYINRLLHIRGTTAYILHDYSDTLLMISSSYKTMIIIIFRYFVSSKVAWVTKNLEDGRKMSLGSKTGVFHEVQLASEKVLLEWFNGINSINTRNTGIQRRNKWESRSASQSSLCGQSLVPEMTWSPALHMHANLRTYGPIILKLKSLRNFRHRASLFLFPHF